MQDCPASGNTSTSQGRIGIPTIDTESGKKGSTPAVRCPSQPQEGSHVPNSQLPDSEPLTAIPAVICSHQPQERSHGPDRQLPDSEPITAIPTVICSNQPQESLDGSKRQNAEPEPATIPRSIEAQSPPCRPKTPLYLRLNHPTEDFVNQLGRADQKQNLPAQTAPSQSGSNARGRPRTSGGFVFVARPPPCPEQTASSKHESPTNPASSPQQPTPSKEAVPTNQVPTQGKSETKGTRSNSFLNKKSFFEHLKPSPNPGRNPTPNSKAIYNQPKEANHSLPLLGAPAASQKHCDRPTRQAVERPLSSGERASKPTLETSAEPQKKTGGSVSQASDRLVLPGGQDAKHPVSQSIKERQQQLERSAKEKSQKSSRDIKAPKNEATTPCKPEGPDGGSGRRPQTIPESRSTTPGAQNEKKRKEQSLTKPPGANKTPNSTPSRKPSQMKGRNSEITEQTASSPPSFRRPLSESTATDAVFTSSQCEPSNPPVQGPTNLDGGEIDIPMRSRGDFRARRRWSRTSFPASEIGMGLKSAYHPGLSDRGYGTPYGCDKPTNLELPGAYLRTCQPSRSIKPLRDPGNWVARACGHFSRRSLNESYDEAYKQLCVHCIANTNRSAVTQADRTEGCLHSTRAAGGSVMSKPSLQEPIRSANLPVSSQVTRHLHHNSGCVPSDKCGEALARDLAAILDTILVEHANTLEQVVENIRSDQPSRVSQEPVVDCRRQNVHYRTNRLPRNSPTGRQQPFSGYDPTGHYTISYPFLPPTLAEELNVGKARYLGPTLNDPREALVEKTQSIIDLIDLVNSAADDFGIDLSRIPGKEDNERFLNAPVQKRTTLVPQGEGMQNGNDWVHKARAQLTALSEARIRFLEELDSIATDLDLSTDQGRYDDCGFHTMENHIRRLSWRFQDSIDSFIKEVTRALGEDTDQKRFIGLLDHVRTESLTEGSPIPSSSYRVITGETRPTQDDQQARSFRTKQAESPTDWDCVPKDPNQDASLEAELKSWVSGMDKFANSTEVEGLNLGEPTTKIWPSIRPGSRELSDGAFLHDNKGGSCDAMTTHTTEQSLPAAPNEDCDYFLLPPDAVERLQIGIPEVYPPLDKLKVRAEDTSFGPLSRNSCRVGRPQADITARLKNF